MKASRFLGFVVYLLRWMSMLSGKINLAFSDVEKLALLPSRLCFRFFAVQHVVGDGMPPAGANSAAGRLVFERVNRYHAFGH